MPLLFPESKNAIGQGGLSESWYRYAVMEGRRRHREMNDSAMDLTTLSMDSPAAEPRHNRNGNPARKINRPFDRIKLPMRREIQRGDFVLSPPVAVNKVSSFHFRRERGEGGGERETDRRGWRLKEVLRACSFLSAKNRF